MVKNIAIFLSFTKLLKLSNEAENQSVKNIVIHEKTFDFIHASVDEELKMSASQRSR